MSKSLLDSTSWEGFEANNVGEQLSYYFQSSRFTGAIFHFLEVLIWFGLLRLGENGAGLAVDIAGGGAEPGGECVGQALLALISDPSHVPVRSN